MGKVPLVLVATQTDLRNDQAVIRKLSNAGLKPVQRSEGLALSKRLGCACYMECSPDMEKKVKQVINKAISSVLIPQDGQDEILSCAIL